MASTIKTLSAIILGAANVMGYSIDTAKVNAVYNDLLNGAGSTEKLNTFIGNFDIQKYCWQPAGAVMQCIDSKDEFKSMMQSKYFSDTYTNVIAKTCTITILSDNLSTDTECEFTLQSTTSQQCAKQTVQQHMDYDPYATSIIQYFDMMPPTITNIDCPAGRRLMSKYWETTTPPKSTPTIKNPINKCYDTEYNNPCNAAQRATGIYYFPSCNSCCNYIQCDEFGVPVERPCANPATYWDQNVLTCNYNNGQCNDYNCPKIATKLPVTTTTTIIKKTPTTTTTKPPATTTTTIIKKTATTRIWTTDSPTTNKPTSPPKKWTKKPCDTDGKNKGKSHNEGKKW